MAGSQIHECTVSLRFLGIILIVLRLEVSIYSVYITNLFQTTFARGEGGGEGEQNPLVEVTVNNKEENSYDFVLTTFKNSASVVSQKLQAVRCNT